MKYLSLLFLIFLFIPSHEPPGLLKGKVADESGEALIAATVSIFRGNERVKGVITDVEGNYKVSVAPGTYRVEFAYVGYAVKVVENVVIESGKEVVLDAQMDASIMLEEVVVTKSHVKRIAKSEHLEAKELTADEIKNLPTRSVHAIAATTSGASGAEAASIRGSRSDATIYYVDGVRVGGEPGRPDKLDFCIMYDPEMDPAYVPPAGDDTARPEPFSGDPDAPAPAPGLLTAGEWNDLHNWNRHWVDLLKDGEIEAYQTDYGFYPVHRYPVMLVNRQDYPLVDIPVRLLDRSGALLWEARTDNTGKAELWAGLFQSLDASPGLRAMATVDGREYEIEALKPASEGITRFQVEKACGAPNNIDIVWAVDATGSMVDEIEYLKSELLDVIGRVKRNNPELGVRMGTVFYRDQGDEYVVKSSPLTADINSTVDYIRQQYAAGGGDYPEAVHEALEEAIFKQSWSRDATARICFLVLDASPHQDTAVLDRIRKSIREAARLGIRIVPVSGSGIRKDTEFLMKFFGLATNGTYVFLTDHSGIGGRHIEPTTDEYKVELLNDLLVRVITEFAVVEDCEGKVAIRFEDPQQALPDSPVNLPQALYYPNPAANEFTLELPEGVQRVTLYDSEGRAVRYVESPTPGIHQVLVSDLPEGFYTLRIMMHGRWQSGKLIVARA